MHTFLGSVKNRSASQPPSRPTPLFLKPPKGVRRSRSSQQFTHMMPLCTFAATRLARLTAERRNTVIDFIYTAPLEKLRLFSAAFKVRK